MNKIKVFGIIALILIAIFAGVKYFVNGNSSENVKYKDDYTGISFSHSKEWGRVIRQDTFFTDEYSVVNNEATKTGRKILRLENTEMKSGEMIKFNFVEGDGDYFNVRDPKPEVYVFSSDFEEIKPEGDGSQFIIPTGVRKDILNNPDSDTLKDFACSGSSPRIFGKSKEIECKSILVDGKNCLVANDAEQFDKAIIEMDVKKM